MNSQFATQRKPRFWAFVFITCAALFTIVGLAVQRQTVYADGVVGDGTPGSCTEAAFLVAIATDGDVTFNCGGPATITLTSRVVLIGRSLMIDGGNEITLARDSGESEFNLFRLIGTTSLELRNLTLTGGLSSGNTPDEYGGAASVGDSSSLRVYSSTVRNNQAVQGGAFFSAGQLIVENSALISNTATTGDGGGIRMAANVNARLELVNSTVAYNITGNKGGGISSNITSTNHIVHSTIAFNQADRETGGIFMAGASTTLYLTDTIVTSNTATTNDDGNCTATSGLVSSGVFEDINNSCGGTVSPLVSSRLGALGDNGGPTSTFPLLADHPAIDQAVSCQSLANTALTIDQRGFPRPRGTACDVGAYEYDPPLLSLSGPGSVAENVGSTTITANLSRAISVAITGSVTSAYNQLNQSFSIPANGTSQTISISITDDQIDEDTEIITIALSNQVQGGKVTPSTQGLQLSITDDDPEPQLSINSQSESEAIAPGNMIFTVSMDNPAGSGKTVQVNYATVDGTATGGSDFTAQSGTLTFNPGETSKQIMVPLIADTTLEPDETFTVVLSNPTNATLSANSGTGTITNDDTFQGLVYLPIVQNLSSGSK